MAALVDSSPSVLAALRKACEFCSLQELCWPAELTLDELDRLQSVVRHTRELSPGTYVYRTGDQFTAIYALRHGCVKSFSLDAGGHELVHGFHLRGELLGFDAVFPERHRCNAVVLESCSLCVVPYADIDALSREFAGLQNHVLQLMSREFSRQLTYGKGFGAKQRLAAFLLNIHARLGPTGPADYQINLPMCREDIASYIGISPETLSRLLSSFSRKRLIEVRRRKIRLLDPLRLDLVAQGVQ